MVKRVTGIGGIFFKSENPESLYEWYERHLGIKRDPVEGVIFNWRDAEDPSRKGMTVWSLFPKETKYLDPRPCQLHGELPGRRFGRVAASPAGGGRRSRWGGGFRIRPIRLDHRSGR